MRISKKELSRDEMGAMSPKEFREMIRQGELPETESPQFYCRGYSQHGVAMIPRDYAFEFLLFCNRNPRPCYVCDVTEPGSPHAPFLAPKADLRTDLPRYTVFKDGKVIDEPTDVKKYWRDDLVSFLLACSWGWAGPARAYNVNFRYIGAYTTNIPCVPAGRFKCDHMIVSSSVFKTSYDAVRAIQICSRLPCGHGAPIHIGDPSAIGIKNIYEPDVYHPYPISPLEPNEVILTWGCAVTPVNAIKEAKPPLAIHSYPGQVFVSDRLTEELAYTYTNEFVTGLGARVEKG